MARNSAVNLDISNNADGFEVSGGSTKRKFEVTGGDITASGSSSASGNTHIFPSYSGNLVGVATGSYSNYEAPVWTGSVFAMSKPGAVSPAPDILHNGMFMNCSTRGYGNLPEDWGMVSGSSGNVVQGGIYSFNRNDVYQLLPNVDAGPTPIKGLWPLNEASGGANDISAYNDDLTDHNTVGSSTGGRMAYARDFNSSNSEYFSAANASVAQLEISGSQTWAISFCADAISAGTLMAKYKNTASSNGKKLELLSDGRVKFTLGGLTTNTSVTSTVRCEAGKWYFVVGTYDSDNNELSVLVNGVRDVVTASGTVGDSNSDFTIGCDLGGASDVADNFYDGKMNTGFVFDVALTYTEAMMLWEYFGGLSGVKISGDGTGTAISQSAKDLFTGLLHGTNSADYTIRYLYYSTAPGAYIKAYDSGSDYVEYSLSSGAQYLGVRQFDKGGIEPQREIKLEIGTTGTGDLYIRRVGLMVGNNVEVWGHAPSAGDLAKIPGLVLRRPPQSTNGYSFEENRAFTWSSDQAAVTGFSGTPSVDIKYVVHGEAAEVYADISGTSDDTSFAFRAPVKASANVHTSVMLEDNGAPAASPGRASISSDDPTTVTVTKDWTGSAFTSSGAKGVTGLAMHVLSEIE